ncbi:WSCD family member CG9164-like [Hyposmocoma kahamanoa]|uniref:WSCD family member CG9164-like n=1 Tax=Hyposmocoma kahamanoa TaxID=1477025 RepID=UPI000E6D7ED6|nr:WSCD family member CG9164-like [Hyposmocoma kahamanoa]
MYNDTLLHGVGFPGEYCNDGSVLVVKNHYDVNRTIKSAQFDSIILLIRNPRDSILATYNMEYAKKIEYEQSDNETIVLINFHVFVAPPSVFRKSPDKWSSRVTFHLQEWTKLYTDWLTNYQGPILVVFYENLINDTRNELKSILDFLNVTVSEWDIMCAIDRQNDLDNIFRRLKKFKYFDPFTKDMYKKMELAKNRVYSLVK